MLISHTNLSRVAGESVPVVGALSCAAIGLCLDVLYNETNMWEEKNIIKRVHGEKTESVEVEILKCCDGIIFRIVREEVSSIKIFIAVSYQVTTGGRPSANKGGKMKVNGGPRSSRLNWARSI